MKYFYITISGIVLLFSCQKDMNRQQPSSPISKLKKVLEDSMQASDIAALDFERLVISRVDSLHQMYVRIPFKHEAISHHFVLLKSDEDYRIQKGKIIELEMTHSVTTSERPVTVEGSVLIESLNRKTSLSSTIHDGYITKRHVPVTGRTSSLLAPEKPEVIIVYYEDYGYSDWMYMDGFLYDPYIDGGTADGDGGYYSPTNSDGSSSNGLVTISPIMMVDTEEQDTDPAIDIAQYLKCFGLIPDAGAVCSIEILTDIPVDGDPSKFFNWQTKSPGHTFIKLNKKNAGQSVQQIIGWYPLIGYKLLFSSDPIEGKFVNNAYHEYNASIRLDISPAQLQAAINEIISLSAYIKYDIDEYNCTDFALDVYNHAVSDIDKISIMKYFIPSGTTSNGTNTPNGLYQFLANIKSTNSLNADKIEIPGVKGWVGAAAGPCN